MLPGETIGNGALYNGDCPDCGEPMPVEVCHSAAGFYIGTFCATCGPYSRESGYYPTREKAQDVLERGNYERI